MEKQRENIPRNDKRWMSNEQIEINAEKRTDSIVDGMAALHDPDQVVGGFFQDNIKHMGRSDVNSYLGPSMKGGRVKQMRDAAIRQQNLGKGSSNISLTLKPLNPKK